MRNYKKKTSEERKKEVDLLIENAEKQIEKYFDTPEQIKELSEFMSKFYNYSIRNSILINKQFLGAVAVGSYAFWQSKGFQVNKGEKGIKILVPTKLGDRFINEKGEITLLSKANEREKNLINKGELEFIKGKIVFKQGYVFDVAQTNAKSSDLPKIFPNKWLDGEVKDYKAMYEGLKKIAENNGVKIIKPKSELGVAKGASYTLTKEIALNPRNTEIHNVKTLLHELAHAKIHDLENNHKYTKNEKEFQAELTAYTVSKYFGIDTSEYSFRYIKAWTKDIELKDKIKLIEEVRETSKEFIETLEDTLIKEKTNEKNIENDKNSEESEKNITVSKSTIPKNEKELQEIYKEWRKGVEIEGMPFKWLGNEKNINAFSEFANLDKPVDFKTMIDLESNLDLENVKEFEVGKIYKTNANYNLEDGSFVKKGTNFYVISKKQYGYNIKFENNRGCKFEDSSRKYYIDELDLEVFANPEKPINREYNKSNKKDLERSKTKNYDYKRANYYDVNRLKEIPIKEVCEQLGLELKRGSNNKLWTKIRNEKSSSCCINLDKNYWYDFGVGYGGDNIKLVEEVRGISSKEAIKELAEMFGIEGENVKNNFYLSKDDYKLIGIEPDRATLNLDINLEKQSIEEIKEIEKIYGRSMNELANYDKNKFLEIIKEKSLPVLIENVALLEGNLNKYKDLFKAKNEPDLEVYLYKKGLDDLDGAITKKASILKNIGLEKECDEIMKYKSKFEKDIKKYMKENSLENVFVEVKNSEVKEIQQGIYKFKDINRELEIKEAIVRKIRADEYFPMLNLNLKVDTLENKIDFNVNFKVGDGKTSDLIEEIKLLENENAINFIKEYDRELRNIGHSKSQKEVIEKHEEWLRTHGKSGECLDLSYKNLEGIEIRNKDLRHSNFKNCTMSNCVIYADLTNANLKNIELKNTKFIGSKLTGVKINPTTLDIINTQISEEENKHYKAKENLKTNKLEEKSLKIKL